MELTRILQLLKNSGFHVLGMDGNFIALEDPACFLRSISDFMDVAWIVLGFITGVLLFGWAVSMIRGAKSNVLMNLRNLMLIFGILTAVKPIINVVWGGDLFATGCRTILVPVDGVKRLLATRDATLTGRAGDSPEIFDIWDSAAGDDYVNAMQNLDPSALTQTFGNQGNTTNNMGLSGAGHPGQFPGGKVVNSVPSGANSVNNTALASSSISTASGGDVIYTAPDGRRTRRTGGSRAWRNKNPGNIRYSEFARKNGAIGAAGGFAVFPNENAGQNAIKSLLRSKNYNRLTVAGAINRYAPPFENDTHAYQARLGQLTGLNIHTPMSTLNEEQVQRVVHAIMSIEGWKPGQEASL